MITTSSSGYGTECTVVRSAREPDLFYMNMKVFEVTRMPNGLGSASAEVSNIWCAVYHVNRPGHAAGKDSELLET